MRKRVHSGRNPSAKQLAEAERILAMHPLQQMSHPSAALADLTKLTHINTYGNLPEFYLDRPFTCRICGKREIWKAKDQKWYYEEAKGHTDATAVECSACRKLKKLENGRSGAGVSKLMRFPTAVKRHRGINAWAREFPDALGEIARRWFDVMRNCGDDVRELLHDGHPTACVGDAAFAYVDVFTAHVNVGFFRGAEIADPKKLLQGSGKLMRHIKLKPGSNIDEAALRKLIAAAYKDMRARVKAG